MTLGDKLKRYYKSLSFWEKLELYRTLIQLKFAWDKFMAMVEGKPPPKSPQDASRQGEEWDHVKKRPREKH